jgi:Cu2+-containing amine oxidase
MANYTLDPRNGSKRVYSPRMASAKKVAKAAKGSKPKAKPPSKAPPKSAPKPGGGRRSPDVADSDPTLFDPLTHGEVADALRTLTEDRRLSSMAKVGRYRVICTEPLVVKPPHWMAGHRLARVVAYDYATDRCVDACIDLDAGVVAHLELTKAQPMLSRDEEALAVSIAMTDERVRSKLTLGESPQSTMHYWGRTSDDVSYARRSAAVVFGRSDGHSTLVAIVDLLDNAVTQVVPAELF